MKRWWWRLARYGRPYWRTLTIVVLFMLAAVAMEALRPWPMKLIVDNVLTGEPLPNTIAWLTLLPGADTQAGLLAWLALATVFVFLASRSADAQILGNEPSRLVTIQGGGLGAFKSAMKLIGHDCGPVRSPLVNLTCEQERTLFDILEKDGFSELAAL